MTYLISASMAGAGVVLLLTLLVRLIRPARLLVGTTRTCRVRLADRHGPLTARIADLRGELDRRRRARHVRTPLVTPTA